MVKRNKFYALCLSSLALLISCESTEKVEEPAVQIEEPVIEQEEPQIDEEPVQEEDEFSRSTKEVDISVEEFNKDKRIILQIITELSDVMADKNYEKWLSYIDPESINYWSNPNNLKQASKRLPVKNLRLANLYDYFIFVFCPSRKGRTVDEIRYISLDSVKAVQVSDEVDVVYYNFVKINDKWMVKIPPLSSQE